MMKKKRWMKKDKDKVNLLYLPSIILIQCYIMQEGNRATFLIYMDTVTLSHNLHPQHKDLPTILLLLIFLLDLLLLLMLIIVNLMLTLIEN